MQHLAFSIFIFGMVRICCSRLAFDYAGQMLPQRAMPTMCGGHECILGAERIRLTLACMASHLMQVFFSLEAGLTCLANPRYAKTCVLGWSSIAAEGAACLACAAAMHWACRAAVWQAAWQPLCTHSAAVPLGLASPCLLPVRCYLLTTCYLFPTSRGAGSTSGWT